MAALSMKGLQDTASFVRAFTGSHRHILDYLSEEILNRQSAEVQRFLLYTSILSRLTGRLCDAILSRGAEEQGSRGEKELKELKELSRGSPTGRLRTGEEMLQYLEQANLFLVPLDHERRWYRYHHLFADLLRRRLEQTLDAQEIAQLHRRAAEWHEQHGLATDAMSHALAAVDVERVIRLALQKAATLLSHSELVTMLSWLDVLPEELTRSHPRISLFRAWALLLTGQLEQVEAHLQEAERQFEPDESETDLLGERSVLEELVAGRARWLKPPEPLAKLMPLARPRVISR
jgi:LuxR family maltose regulon positive regulatory protein